MIHRSFLTRQLLLRQFDDWFLDSYLCILKGGKSEIWVFRSMACRRDIVPHSGIMPVSNLQRSSNDSRFRSSRISDNYSLWFCVSFEFIVSNIARASSYFSLHSFSSSFKSWNMLTIIIYLLVDWISRNFKKKKRKRWTICFAVARFQVKDTRRFKA